MKVLYSSSADVRKVSVRVKVHAGMQTPAELREWLEACVEVEVELGGELI